MPNPNCKYGCTGCKKTKPDGPIEKVIRGVMYYSVKPSCHHNSACGAFERGFQPSDLPTKIPCIPRTQLA
ncbi:MAG: hypothetical protein KBC41_03710 [Candidatus Pacebacteria bacterium]|nr:hypothetical protein [Candidatus Paceibacterota bacterium]MBP9867153.1 hypothetical protein [Candidatus Paceibacterota bacterium]